MRALLKRLKQQLEASGELNAAEAHSAGPAPEVPLDDPGWDESDVDDVSGGILPAAEMRKAREEETEHLHGQGVYEVVRLEDCIGERARSSLE